MLGVVVDLVAGEEEDVGVDFYHIFQQVHAGNVTTVGRSDRVAGESGNDDLFLVYRVLADATVVESCGSVGDAILDVRAVVPVLDAEGRRPAVFNDLLGRDLLPAGVAGSPQE